MSPNLENELFEKYPHLFQDGEGAVSCRTIDVGDGWFPIIEKFLKASYEHFEATGISIDEFQIIEIKEKFGSLRLYSNVYEETIFKLSEQAYDESLHICELSGQPGSLFTKFGMVKTLSPDVAAQYG